ncbi:MAG: aminopeptidase [Spirochaetales bacterium]|nr:aminopeptidase [Spirochaetales bacterium]
MRSQSENERLYAELLVRVGVNVQKGQTLVLACPVECAEFAHRLVEEAYKAGAREVVMRWIDERVSRLTLDMADDAVFDEFPEWGKAFFNGYSKDGAAFLSIVASDPEIMKGADPKRMSRQVKARSSALEYFRNRQMSNQNSWCVGSVPSIAWARKVFPGKPDADAMALLWSSIFSAVRVTEDDPVHAWRDHQAALNKRLDFLNTKQFSELRYSNALGTELSVKLPKDHLWFGGGDPHPNGYVFVANMPTEEVFTMPHSAGANGKVVSSMPLSHNGNLINKFWFQFKDGLVVDYGAEEGLSVLKELMETDGGARRLGEVALVPHDSPISNQRILFYNTLFDENASCHFALGKAYPTCVKGGPDMSKEELAAAGANDSLVHVDFMVGSPDLSIDGVDASGAVTPVFRAGNFVI